MQRTVVKQLGFNIDALIGKARRASSSASSRRPPASASTAPPVGRRPTDRHRHTVRKPTATRRRTAAIQAFERVGLVRTLAEPNLTAVSGESAKFLAGGEFPVPVGQDNDGRITVEFKPFGVGLGFTPVVLSDGRISLKISTEVSELTTEGAFGVSARQRRPWSSRR